MRAVLAASLLLAAATRADDLAARAARSYRLDATPPPALAVGEEGTALVSVRCEDGVHLQRQAPLRVVASGSPGLLVARPRLGWGDVRETRDTQVVEVPVSVKGGAPGAATLQMRLDFFVCSREWCVRQEREVAVPVAVAAASPAKPAGP